MRDLIEILYEQPLYLFSLAIFISTITIILLFSLSYKINLIDKPGGRKQHSQNIPLIGGIAIYIATSILLGPIFIQKTQHFALWISSLLIVTICVLDDMKAIKVNHRLLAQLIAIGILITIGQTTITSLGNLIGFGNINLGWLSLPFTFFTLIGVINAVNMMDGIDGITGCVSFVELGLMGYLAVIIGAKFELTVIICFMGAILGFLIFNFPHKLLTKRKIFLGDTGSMLIGLILAWLTARLTQGTNGFPPVLMLWIMALPLMDTIHIIFNRKARGISPFKADRRHIHHILLQLNYSPAQTPILLMLVAFMIGAAGVLLYMKGVRENVLFAGILAIFFVYLNVSIYLKRKVVGNKFRSYGKGKKRLHEFQKKTDISLL